MVRKSPVVSLVLFLASLAAAASVVTMELGCVGTPLPDPPSASATEMTLIAQRADLLQLDGRDGAIRPGGGRLRISNPTTGDAMGRIEVAVSPTGAFSGAVAGTLADTIYLESVRPSGDVFLVAVASTGDGLAIVDAPDTDGDRSPDAIDCAALDPALAARECPPATRPCASDRDCDPTETCVDGACRGATCAPAETCGNGLDDDCTGVIDDGC